MKKERKRRAPGIRLVAAGAVVVLAAACSSDDPAGSQREDGLERLIGSAAATRSAGTARIEQEIMMEFPEGTVGGSGPQVDGGTITVLSEGLIDLRGRRGRMSVSTDGRGLAGADALGGDMDVIYDGEAMYMRSPFYSQLAPNHEPWLRVTFEELGLRGMSQLGQQDPLAFVEGLRGVYGNAEHVGRDDVRGEATTHYRAEIDIERLLSKLPRDTRSTVAAMFRQLGIAKMPIDAWLDDEGRLRRMTSDVALGGETTEGGRMRLALELYGFGVAFDLRRPPPGQVAEFGEVFGETGDG